ncbi:MAG TPA: molybdopterin molybdotransferase MoeA [Oligoflexus sp.]|uniref:molybdopterin molybdotransferase MoeA n=1 Tax=Oligoflexus sp. TaxID=1971216 RepID=UPI002D49A677|nr:molybdopterin molybdotransferase MoeA [Oligoflexus sp.]HYX36070.1 molybdopterin molybdotransferase MoeA [Oligoflexus sp.]
MLSYQDAHAIVRIRGHERQMYRLDDRRDVPLFSAQGHILADELRSPEAVPAFDNSAMDGYAVRAADLALATEDSAVALPLLGTLAAGDEPKAFHEHGAVEIMTGAPVPTGIFDAVIRVEDTEKDREHNQVLFKRSIGVGDNIRRRGSDFDRDQPLAARGQTVTPELMMSAASLGLDTLPVQDPLRIALLITGRELSRFTDKDLRAGMIRDASGPFLQASLHRPDFDLVAHKMLIDDAALFQAEALKILELQPDIIISTGAVSMGKYDFIKDSLLELGAELHFHKVAMRPGKPLLFAEWRNGPVWFGLPGNPVSSVVGWRFFVDPYVRALRGQAPEQPATGRLSQPYKKPAALICFLKAHSEVIEGALQVRILEGQGSYMLSPLLKANCWAALDSEAAYLEQGSLVKVYPLSALA